MKETITTTETIMIPLRRMAAEYFSPEVASSLRFEVRDMYDRLAKQVVTLIDLPSQPITEASGVSRVVVPDTWFDHLRNDYFPNFLARRFPIKRRTIEIPYTIEIRAVYPKLPHGFNYGGVIKFASVEKVHPYISEMRTQEYD